MSEGWVTIATFVEPTEAHLARTRLEAEGIPCVLTNEFLARVLPSAAVGGVRLLVAPADQRRARDLLRPRPHLVVLAEPGAESTPEGDRICPRCRSYDVYFFEHDGGYSALLELFFGFLRPWRSHKWMCKECGYEWKERASG
ncbi:MAG: DUF2007 domain-containing protein [Candidatus Krumholzibacteria bacterium]|nr:DUF2007 domain-containing protein [Candidatus Krumholzibacteria bacterium]